MGRTNIPTASKRNANIAKATGAPGLVVPGATGKKNQNPDQFSNHELALTATQPSNSNLTSQSNKTTTTTASGNGRNEGTPKNLEVSKREGDLVVKQKLIAREVTSSGFDEQLTSPNRSADYIVNSSNGSALDNRDEIFTAADGKLTVYLWKCSV